MAEPYDTLLRVQQHDTDLDQLRHRIEALPERAALVDVRSRPAALAVTTAEVQALVDDLAGRQAALEEQIAATGRPAPRAGGAHADRGRDRRPGPPGHGPRGRPAGRPPAPLEDEEILLMEEEEPLDAALAGQLGGGRPWRPKRCG